MIWTASVNVALSRAPSQWVRAGTAEATATATGISTASQIVTLDRAVLTERVSRLSQAKLQLVLAGIDIVLGRP